MAQPTVKCEVNIGTEGSPSWSEVESSHELIFTKSTMTGSTGQDSIPYLTKPGSGIGYAEDMWKGSSGEYTQISVYGNASSAINVLRWTWDGAMNSAPIFTAYPTTGHANPTAGDGSVLGGHATDTSQTSYEKMVMTDSGVSQSWCTATTGAAGAVTTKLTGQSIQGEIQYLQLSSTPSGSGYQTCGIFMYIGANETTGTHTPVLSCKYTWT